MSNHWIQIDQLAQGTMLKVELGTRSRTFKNISHTEAKELAKREIIAGIRKYVNHRSYVIQKFGSIDMPSKTQSLTRLKYAFSGNTGRWTLEQLPRIIRNWSSDLQNIAPGPRSKYYKSQSQFLIDLLSWANSNDKSKWI